MPVKIMDEKGRLFGKLNVIDLLVILLVIGAAVFLFLRREKPDPQPQEPEPKFELTYQVQVSRLDPKIYESIKQYVDPEQGLKDQLFESNQYLDAYVTDCAVSPHVEYVATSDGQIKRVESRGDDQRLDAVVTLQGWATDPMTNQVGSQQLRAGAGYYIQTTHFEISGVILSVERTQP